MLGGPGLRFTLEAAFLIALAVAAGIAELSATTIVLVMAGAWLLVATIEWLAWRETPGVTRVGRPEPAAAEPRRRRRFWWRKDATDAAPMPAAAARTDEDTADLAPLPDEAAAARADERSAR